MRLALRHCPGPKRHLRYAVARKVAIQDSSAEAFGLDRLGSGISSLRI